MTDLTQSTHPPVSAHADPPGEPPWAMQLVMRLEKTDPPTRSQVCTAAAQAVAALVTDARAAEDGAWAAPLQRWMRGRIRKHARRARGSAWQRTLELEGVTATCGSAQVRALVPGSTAEIPREVARLQLAGTEPHDPHPVRRGEPAIGGPVVVALCPEPFLPLGKAAAAAGHAAQLAALQMHPARRDRWAEDGFPVILEQPDPDRWAALRAVAPVQIVDAGLTEVAPGTCTALARWA